MFAKISKKGQITLPAEVRRRLKVGSGEFVKFVLDGNEVRLEPAPKGIESLRGCIVVEGEQDFKSARHSAMEIRVHENTHRR
jgi:antitoxin PrlF